MMETASNRQNRADAIERHLGDRLKSLRMARRLSRAKVDDMTIQPPGTCKMLEQGEAVFGPTQLYALATTFAVDPSFFFDGLPFGDIVPLEESAMTPETRSLIEAFQHIGDADLRRSIIGIFKAVAEDPSYGENIKPLRRGALRP